MDASSNTRQPGQVPDAVRDEMRHQAEVDDADLSPPDKVKARAAIRKVADETVGGDRPAEHRE